MKKIIILLLIVCACIEKLQAQDFDIKTIVGCDSFGAYGGDGGFAINAKLWDPENLYLDGRGNLYIADLVNHRIRKVVLTTGIITTIAGIDTFGYAGDGGPATNAILWYPEAIFTDTFGNIFFADGVDNCVRKIMISTGIITTIVGNGITGSTGDGGLATNAELNGPTGLCLDRFQNIYVVEYFGNKVRKIDGTTGIITTIAGTGTAGSTGIGGPATNAELNEPVSVFIDNSGNIFISDGNNNTIHKVDISTGIITNIAGTGTAGYSGNGGLAINAKLSGPEGGFFDKQNNLFFADYDNGAIRRIDGSTGIITTVAGNGTWGFSGDGGPAVDAELIPVDVVLDSNGSMYIADYGNNRIRMVYNTLAVKPLNANNEISIYPNPAQDNLTIENANGNELTIFNILGEPVFKKIIASNSETINISNLPNDIYMVQIVDPEKMIRITKKVVKFN